MQKFPLEVTQDEINVLGAALDSLLRREGNQYGINVAVPVAGLLIKIQQAQPIVEADLIAEPALEPQTTTVADARAAAEKLKAKEAE